MTEKMDKEAFFGGAKVKTAHTLKCTGTVTSEDRPVQVSYRLPAEQVNWIKQNMPKRANYGVSKLLAYAIKEVKQKLAEDDFDIDWL